MAGDGETSGWSLRLALVVLGFATVITALVAEILVGSINSFATDSGVSEFFLAAVVIAIVGNAAEHGGAVVVAYRGKIKLASRDRPLVERAGGGLPDPGGRAARVADRAAGAGVPSRWRLPRSRCPS